MEITKDKHRINIENQQRKSTDKVVSGNLIILNLSSMPTRRGLEGARLR